MLMPTQGWGAGKPPVITPRREEGEPNPRASGEDVIAALFSLVLLVIVVIGVVRYADRIFLKASALGNVYYISRVNF